MGRIVFLAIEKQPFALDIQHLVNQIFGFNISELEGLLLM